MGHHLGLVLSLLVCGVGSSSASDVAACADCECGVGAARAPCAPGNELCGAPFGRGAAQYHVRDESCQENDPNFPFYDAAHGLYHLFWQAHRARGFEMSILYHNRSPVSNDVEASLGGARFCADLGTLLEASDYIVLVAPLTALTRHMINATALARCRPGSIIINVGRGELIDQEALVECLINGSTVAAAGLDVTYPEPLPRGHPLLALRNVVLSPHTGTATLHTRNAMNVMAVENLVKGLAVEPVTN
jgi:hypothetical protein